MRIMKFEESFSPETRRKLWEACYQQEVHAHRRDRKGGFHKGDVDVRLAVKLDVTSQTIYNYRTGKTAPKGDQLSKIMDLLPFTEVLEIVLPDLSESLSIFSDWMMSEEYDRPLVGNQQLRKLNRLLHNLIEDANALKLIAKGMQLQIRKPVDEKLSKIDVMKCVEYFGFLLKAAVKAAKTDEWYFWPRKEEDAEELKFRVAMFFYYLLGKGNNKVSNAVAGKEVPLIMAHFGVATSWLLAGFKAAVSGKDVWRFGIPEACRDCVTEEFRSKFDQRVSAAISNASLPGITHVESFKWTGLRDGG